MLYFITKITNLPNIKYERNTTIITNNCFKLKNELRMSFLFNINNH